MAVPPLNWGAPTPLVIELPNNHKHKKLGNRPIFPPRTPPCHSVTMADDGTDSAALLEPPKASQLPPGLRNQSSRPPPLSPKLSREPVDYFDGWRTIGEQQDFYNEQDCLHPSHNLTSGRLKLRNEHDVVIFDYSLYPDYLNRADEDPFEEGGPSSGHFSADDDIFFQVSKNELIGSKQFDQIINLTKEPLQISSRGLRLGIM